MSTRMTPIDNMQDLRWLALRAGWPAGAQVLEFAAGAGDATACLAELGYAAAGVEADAELVAAGQAAHPELALVAADPASYVPAVPGQVFCRDAAVWRYGLDGVNELGVDVPAVTAHVMGQQVAPGAAFALELTTNRTGSHIDGQPHNPTDDQLRTLFAPHGQVTVLSWKPGYRARGVVVITRRPE